MIPYITITENQLKAVFGNKFSLAAVKRDRKLLKLFKNYLYHNGFERTMANGNNSFTFELLLNVLTPLGKRLEGLLLMLGCIQETAL